MRKLSVRWQGGQDLLPALVVLLLVAAPSISLADAGTEPDLQPANSPGRSVITLVWWDQGQPYGFHLMKGEVERIYRDVGVRLVWAMARTDAIEHLGAWGPTLYVFLLNQTLPGLSTRENVVMGATRTVPNASRIIYVSYPNVLDALGFASGSTRLYRIGVQREVSWALARVLAHEIVHALDPEIPHTAGGLMCRSLGRWFLTRGRPRLGSQVAETLRRRLGQAEEPMDVGRGGYR